MSTIGNRENSTEVRNHSGGERENVAGGCETDKTVNAVTGDNPNVKGTDDQLHARGDEGASFCQAIVPYRSAFDFLGISPATTHEMLSPGPPTFANGRPATATYSLVGNGQFTRGDVGASVCQAVVPYRSPFDILGISPATTHEMLPTFANGRPTAATYSLVGDGQFARGDVGASICQAVVPYRSAFDILGINTANSNEIVHPADVVPYRSPFDLLGINAANSGEMVSSRVGPNNTTEQGINVEASPSDEMITPGASPIDTDEHGVKVEASPSDIDIEYIDRARNDIADFVEEFRGYLAFIDALDALSECLDGVSTVVFRENEVVFQRRSVFDEDDDDDDDDDEDDMNPFINLCCSH